MSYAVKISSKGQITLPRRVREELGSNVVEFDIVDGKVILQPVKSVAGALAAYAGGDTPLSEVRRQVWQEVADERQN